MAEINDIFAKRKAKKGSKKFGRNLNKFDEKIETPKNEEKKPKAINENIVDDEISNDEGWVDIVERKKPVVHTGGRQVAEFLNLDELRTVDDIVAERVYKEDVMKEFVEARSSALKKENEKLASNEVASSTKNEKENPQTTGVALWRPSIRMKQLMKEAVVDTSDVAAFPSLEGSNLNLKKSIETTNSIWGNRSAVVLSNHTEDLSTLVEDKLSDSTAEDNKLSSVIQIAKPIANDDIIVETAGTKKVADMTNVFKNSNVESKEFEKIVTLNDNEGEAVEISLVANDGKDVIVSNLITDELRKLEETPAAAGHENDDAAKEEEISATQLIQTLKKKKKKSKA